MAEESTKYLITAPLSFCLGMNDDIKKWLTEENVKVLCSLVFPTAANVSPQEMIGPPDEGLSDSVCELLHNQGLMTKTPLLNKYGKQVFVVVNDQKLPVDSFAWVENPDFSSLPREVLFEVAWDLRFHPNFIHLRKLDDREDSIEVKTEEILTETLDNEEGDLYSGEIVAGVSNLSELDDVGDEPTP